MMKKAGKGKDTQVVCDCGLIMSKTSILKHIKTKKSSANQNCTNPTLKVKQLKNATVEAEFNWHTKEFKEMARGMQKDDIFYVGAREPILVKYETK